MDTFILYSPQYKRLAIRFSILNTISLVTKKLRHFTVSESNEKHKNTPICRLFLRFLNANYIF